ncbi:c6 zinc finger domain containing protein [Penicillium antarcticum]|uniref:c6 zinc finger domain containing protein n=1 Tax=Penicillium antarcticum TaxID=416450 RepID=UPI0023841C01|nr:c6 zinc finger domain containing protein [Penicillium antarcticum]KAJ5319887.1 c6 zinc finger domain containing protein [Penicillium antarcticum]
MSAMSAAQSDSTSSDSSISFLRRRYSLLEMVASLTLDGFPAEDLNYGSSETSSQPTRVFFDDYAGCYPEIFEIFHQIRAVAWERGQRERNSHDFVSLSDSDFYSEPANLESRILAMIERDESTRPCFSPSLQGTLDEKQTLEFAYCNLLLEYTALIHIRTQIMSLDPEAMEVQQPVKMIIHLIQQLEPPSGLSPVLGVNTALFIAGRYAFGADRMTVQSLLVRFHRKMYNYNMVNAMDILDLIWRQVDSGQKNIGTSCKI